VSVVVASNMSLLGNDDDDVEVLVVVSVAEEGRGGDEQRGVIAAGLDFDKAVYGGGGDEDAGEKELPTEAMAARVSS
jgi:hypothetical protein